MIGFVLFLLVSAANALPEGAPSSVCKTMVPFHGGGISRQQGQSPYGVTAIRNGAQVTVTVKSPTEIPFRGIMMNARDQDGQIFGTFEPLTGEVHTIDCQEPGDTITHNHPQPRPEVQVVWKPPTGYQGVVTFNATIAQDYSTFWVGVPTSLRLTRQAEEVETNLPVTPKVISTTPPHFIPQEPAGSTRADDPFYDGCGVSKLCFGSASGCVETQNCPAVVAVTVSGDRYEFEMKTQQEAGWVGLGLSEDAQMGDDSVVECVKDGTNVKAYTSWTSARPNLGVSRLPNPQYGIKLLEGKIVDGAIYCKVLRNIQTTINGKDFHLVNNPYHILVAAGANVQQNSVGFHDIGYLASAEKRYLSDVSEVAGASKLLLRLHGAFMLAAWIGTASLGTFIARYYRKTWVGKMMCGKDLWFAWHRFFMVLTWALTSVAFVLIFVELKAWSTENNPHAILGCVVTALCFMQPIGAFFRPHPGTPKRPVFNWLHWFGGNAAHIIAIVTIFFAVKLNKAELPEWFDWILVAFVAFHVLMHLVLSILGCVSDKSSGQRVTSFPMKELSSSGKISNHMLSTDAPYSGTRKALLGLYILIVGALTAALIVVTVLAPIEL